MAKQLFSEGLLRMAGVPLEEEPRKILEPRRVEDRQKKGKQVEWKRLTELIKQTGGRIRELNLNNSELTELPEGIISANKLILKSSKIQKLPNSLKRVSILDLTESKIEKLPENLRVRAIIVEDCKYLKVVPTYSTLKALHLTDSTVEEIGEYPELEWLFCIRTPFLKKTGQEAKSQGIDVKEYIKQKHKLPQTCKVYL